MTRAGLATHPGKPLRYLVAVAVASLILPSTETLARDAVTPLRHEAFFFSAPGEDSFTLRIDLENAPPTREPVDVFLLFDCTGSMRNVIDEVRDRSQYLIEELQKSFANLAFGVGSLADEGPGQFPWRLHQEMTTDLAAVQSALGSVSLQNGEDYPELYARGLYEAGLAAWRPDARKYVVLFGDAPAHDPSFYGSDLGTDPGRGGTKGTADDLFLVPVVDGLAARGVRIIGIYDQGGLFKKKPFKEETLRGFSYMAEKTGGMSIPISSAEKVVAAITAGIQQSFRGAPEVFVPPDYHDWVTAAAPKANDDGRQFNFGISLHPPAGTPDGVFRFPIVSMHDSEGRGGRIADTWVTVRIGWMNLDWRVPLLLLYLLGLALAALLFGRRAIGSGMASRVMWDSKGPALRLLGAAVILLVAVAGAILIWKHAPGRLPDHASTPAALVPCDRGGT